MTATDRVRDEWGRRVTAEYRSSAITQHLTLWLTQVGASPDLIRAGLRVAEDELVHAELSHATLVAAGGALTGPIDRATLALPRRAAAIEADLLDQAVRVFCLGETIAVPLFHALRARCTQPEARAALDRVLVDEVRHRDFGWALLDWLLEQDPSRVEGVRRALPAQLAEVAAQYASPHADPTPVTDAEAAWGLMDAAAYAAVFDACLARQFRPLFAARGVALDEVAA